MRRVQLCILLLAYIFSLTACKGTTDISESMSVSEIVPSEVSLEISETFNESESETESQGNSEEYVSEENVPAEVSSEENFLEESNLEEESVSEEPKFTVQEYRASLFAKKAVNVRKGPSTDYEKIGGLNKGEQIQVTGIADTGWYQIQYNGEEAYVAASYLLDEASYQAMIAEEEAAALAAQQAAEQAAAEQAAAEQAAAEQAAQQQAAAEQAAAQQQAQGDYRAQVVALMNQERANAGIGGISQNAALDAVAQLRAQEIVQSFSHTRPDGSSCFTALDQSGVGYMTAGENIAAGYGTPAEVMNGWMNSEGHRANILNGSFGQVGIGFYSDPNTPYGTYWVQVFTN
ncbi:MAG: SH3 domain-containing protein [Lachnospiraceae bacterium]|nr:SH3 domain-containing protein [Lachnospiraceae bacterium]